MIRLTLFPFHWKMYIMKYIFRYWIDVQEFKAHNYVVLTALLGSKCYIFQLAPLLDTQQTSFQTICSFQPQQNIAIVFLDMCNIVVRFCMVLLVSPHDPYCIRSQPLCKVTVGVALVVVVEWVLRPLVRSKTCVEGSSGCMGWISLCTCHQIWEAQWFRGHTAGAAGRIHKSVGHWLRCSVNRW